MNEFAPDGNLRQKMFQPISEFEIAFLLKSLLSGLQYLHSNDIFHLNLKPENILFIDDVLKLDDFGLARNDISNFHYRSPEQLLFDKVGAMSDIWSLGVIVYELAAGKLPFQGDDVDVFTENVINTQYEDIPSSFSLDFKEILGRMLIKIPDDRISLSELLDLFQ